MALCGHGVKAIELRVELVKIANIIWGGLKRLSKYLSTEFDVAVT